MGGGRPLRLATRGSALARWQCAHVASLLGRPVETVVVETTGDRSAGVPIWAMGGQGVFVKEVQAAVLEGRADLAVHSAKDLPSAPTPGLVIGAVPERADPRDALVGARLEDLAPGAQVATGSVRRRAQLAWLRPDLTFGGLRGSIDTRLARVPAGGAVVVAAAALARLGRLDRAAEVLEPWVMLPQAGQGALAVECRAGDGEALEALEAVDHGPSRRSVEAERAFLFEMGPGCDLPVGAHSRPSAGAGLELEGLMATPDGRVLLRRRGSGDDPAAVGRAVALDLLDGCGGRALLEDLGGGGPLGVGGVTP
ncbi:MAG: hydroxymethylbilane synthase [Acidimicrobiales bacterium]